MKRALLALIVISLMVFGVAQAELPAPQNPSWKAGSTATATWDAVEGADYYELTVYVYDEAGTTLLGTTTTGTSATEVDVQLEANTIIKQQETEYTTVQIAYTIKAGVTGENGVITYGAESAMSEQWEYTFALIHLKAPENVVLNEDGTASWNYVENADTYWISIYAKTNGAPGISNRSIRADSVSSENGIISFDFSTLCKAAYMDAVEQGYFKNGVAASVYIEVSAKAPYNSEYYIDSLSRKSNSINYTPFTPVESLTLSPSEPVLYVGNSYYLGKTITPEDGYYTTIDWSSTNNSVVTVDAAGLITGVAEGTADVTAAIDEVQDTVSVKVYTIASNIEDEKDKEHVTDSAGSIIDDIVNNDKPNVDHTDIPKDDLEHVRDEAHKGIWRGDKFFTDMKWYEENFGKYKDNWGQIQQAARHLNAEFAGAYNIEVEMYHKETNGTNHHIGCIEEFENEITFAFDLPAGMDDVQHGYARKYVLVRIHRNEMDTIDVEVKDGKCHAKSNGFSDFVLLYVDEPVDSVDLSGLKTLTLPSSLVTIEDEAFAGIAAEVVIIPESCTTIGSRAFADCKNLKYIVLPLGSDITPANDAFEGCNAEILYK